MEVLGLNQALNSSMKWQNEAGFTFDFEHIIKPGYYYRQEQQEIVAGTDGSFRWRISSKYTFLGLYAVVHYGYLILLANNFPSFKRVYQKNVYLKVFIDVVTAYFVSMMPIYFTDEMF